MIGYGKEVEVHYATVLGMMMSNNKFDGMGADLYMDGSIFQVQIKTHLLNHWYLESGNFFGGVSHIFTSKMKKNFIPVVVGDRWDKTDREEILNQLQMHGCYISDFVLKESIKEFGEEFVRHFKFECKTLSKLNNGFRFEDVNMMIHNHYVNVNSIKTPTDEFVRVPVSDHWDNRKFIGFGEVGVNYVSNNWMRDHLSEKDYERFVERYQVGSAPEIEKTEVVHNEVKKEEIKVPTRTSEMFTIYRYGNDIYININKENVGNKDFMNLKNDPTAIDDGNDVIIKFDVVQNHFNSYKRISSRIKEVLGELKMIKMNLDDYVKVDIY